MNYSQKQLVDLINSGHLFDESYFPKHIQTVISNVFVFENKVYKFYKNDNDFFNKTFRNLFDKDERFYFTEKDFAWNNSLSPSIYLELKSISVKDGQIIEVSRDQAEEILMVMNRVDTTDVLYEKLVADEISKEDCLTIGKQLGESMKKVQTQLSKHYNFFDLFDSKIKDQKNWISSVSENIPLEESKSYSDYLENYRLDNRNWFEKELSEGVTVDGDFHSNNALFSNKNFYLMDTYPPKEDWNIGYKLNGLYRLGTDIWAITGKKELFESLIDGYEESIGIKINRKLDEFYILYAAGISMPYLYMLSHSDPEKKQIAERYHMFVRDYFLNLTSN